MSSAMGTDGIEIDLSESPLQYGGKDADVTGAARTAVDAWEAKRYKNKIEFGVCIDGNGGTLEERRGGSGSVKTSVRALNAAQVFSHVHPRTGGELGGTFSPADIRNFANYGVHTFRATAAEGTYSISKAQGFDGNGLKSYFANEEARLRAIDNQTKTDLNNQYRNGNISWEECRNGHRKSFNAFLVGLHNSLLSGQGQYGYTYTLERR